MPLHARAGARPRNVAPTWTAANGIGWLCNSAYGRSMQTAFEVPALPHMPEAAIAKLRELLTASQCYLEYGSGGSTRLAASLDVPIIYSVESDQAFLNAVAGALGATRSSFRPFYVDIGPTKEWGNPVDDSAFRKWPAYPFNVWQRIKDDGVTPDLVLIDGRFRVACALTSIMHLPAGTTIMVDDYADRVGSYRDIEKHANLQGLVGVAAIFKTRTAVDLTELATDLARACMRFD